MTTRRNEGFNEHALSASEWQISQTRYFRPSVYECRDQRCCRKVLTYSVGLYCPDSRTWSARANNILPTRYGSCHREVDIGGPRATQAIYSNDYLRLSLLTKSLSTTSLLNHLLSTDRSSSMLKLETQIDHSPYIIDSLISLTR